MSKLNADQQFFFDHAGFSYDPQTETRDQGKTRCAMNLAAAEGFARAAGISFEWSQDDIDSSSFSDDEPAWPLYQCLAYDHCGNVCGSLGGVDFGADGSPRTDPYRRVVEAEIAAEYMHETMRAAAA